MTTRKDVLDLIGQCWAGGEYTGRALSAFNAGNYDKARAWALAQLHHQAKRSR